MLYVKAFHVIAMVAWFAGLFYLPRLFVYHADTKDLTSLERFKVMEYKLYYAITWPAALITTFLGIWLISYNPAYYLKSGWMHAKLAFVVLLWIYHGFCGYYLHLFGQNKNKKSAYFYRVFNEIPTVLLVGIVILVIARPF
jgi:putative membrane protein